MYAISIRMGLWMMLASIAFFLLMYTIGLGYRNELHAFLSALTSGSEMPTSPWDGRQALRLAEAAIESVKTGRSVAV